MVIIYANMRTVRNKNPSPAAADIGGLADLSASLKSLLNGNNLTQNDIEEATGVDQTTISRAKNGRLKRMTDKANRLRVYANMRKRIMPISEDVMVAAKAFLSVGGSEEELISSIQLATRIVLRHLTPIGPKAGLRSPTPRSAE